MQADAEMKEKRLMMIMKKLFYGFLIILLAGCADPETEINIPHSPTPSNTTISLESALPMPSSQPDLPVFTEAEMLQFELLRADWTKEQMEAEVLEKEVNELASTTVYSDENISYTYLDWFKTLTPAVVDVFGDISGPRGLRVGDSFEEVMTLFPQDKDWKSDPLGFFYGDVDNEYEQLDYALTGYVTEYEAGNEITLVVEGGFPFLRVFFEDDIMTHYTFYLISAH
ncbi:hypothetical protein [Paenibacillus sp. NPDC057967]|uniref:hypothetical protein n=1 Tax=Paenibacillus sp. NPDC057967 TaxID=3346293 RepID=UPI0036DF89BD